MKALLVILLLATAAGAQPSPSDRQVADLINEKRASAGLAPLTWNDNLWAAAKYHCDDEIAHGGNCDAHNDCTGGRSWDQRLSSYCPSWQYIAENWTFSLENPSYPVNGWWNSAPHKANILGPSTQIGCAMSGPMATGFGSWWAATCDFAIGCGGGPSPSRTPVPTATPQPSPRPTHVKTPRPSRTPKPTPPSPSAKMIGRQACDAGHPLVGWNRLVRRPHGWVICRECLNSSRRKGPARVSAKARAAMAWERS